MATRSKSRGGSNGHRRSAQRTGDHRSRDRGGANGDGDGEAGRGRGRAIWSGSISFGLVNIPVRLYTATQSHTVRFHEMQARTGQRIRHKRVAEGTGREVAYEEIVKGYEVAKGKVVTIEREELEAIEPRMTRTIDIEAFVDLAEIDPIAWNQTYYIGPGSDGAAEKSYQLLHQAMEDMAKVAIGRFVMRTKEYLTTIRPYQRGLALETMYYADELRPFEKIVRLPRNLRVGPQEVALARQLIESLSAPWKHERYRDTFRERVVEMIERKARGKTIEVAEEAEQPAEVIDLMQALKASLGSGGADGGRKRPRSRRGGAHGRSARAA